MIWRNATPVRGVSLDLLTCGSDRSGLGQDLVSCCVQMTPIRHDCFHARMSTMRSTPMPALTKRSLRRAFVPVIGLSVMALGLTACNEAPGQGRYAAYESGVAAHVEEGEVVAFRPVSIGPGNSGTGAVVGGVGGAVVGSQFGGRRSDHVAAGVVGALAGALIGNAVEKNNSQSQGYAYTVRVRRTGELVEIVQPDASPIPNGVHVAISYGARVRISPISGDAMAPPRHP